MKKLDPFIESTILNFTRKKKGIIHGARALNERIPKAVHRETFDFDIYMNKPKLRAKQLEKKLDKRFNRDQFYVKKGKHKGTYKVIDRGKWLKSEKDDRGVADITRPYENVPYDTSLDGVRFAKISYLKKKIQAILKDLKHQYRWKKDKQTLKKIRLYEEMSRRLW
jgi:hypothetical protein